MSQLPVQVLVDEHLLILRMVTIVKNHAQKLNQTGKPDLKLIETAIDFFRTYADRYHHGKEEGILFNTLSSKPLSEADKVAMNDLIMDHATARKTVTTLKNSVDNYDGNPQTIYQALNTLAELYPRHIEKEDKHFFTPIMQYLSKEEQKIMLNSFLDFDKNFINKKYAQTVSTLENPA